MIRLPYRFLYLVVFVSGALAIAYQTIWFRLLSLILGSTSLALTLILTAFMLGLGLGSYLWGKVADRYNPRHLYQVLEGGIGLFAIASLFLLSPVNAAYGTLNQALSASPFLLVGAKFILSLFFVLIPTIFMGGTVPVAIKYLVLDPDIKGKEIGIFYWVNTLGAALMAVMMPLFFMVEFKIPHLLWMAACGNILLVLFVFLLPDRGVQSSPGEKSSSSSSRLPVIALLAFMISGAASLALETLWNRHLIIIFGGSIYTFGFILCVYLLGIVAGSIVYSRLKCEEENHSLKLYTWVLMAASGYVMITLFFLPRIAFYQLKLLGMFPLSFTMYHMSNMILLFLLVFPVTLCFGIAFPAAINGLTLTMKNLGRDTGILYGANSIGTAIGPILMTFFILPLCNFKGSYYIVVILLIISSFIMMAVSGTRMRFSIVGAALVILTLGIFHPEIRQVDFLSRTAQSPRMAVERFRKTGDQPDLERYKVLYARNDVEANVAVVQSPEGIRNLVINGKNDASDGIDMYTQSLSGHIPFLCDREIKKALVIGLGSGVTSHAVLTHDVTSVDSVEISPAVIEAARTQFSHVNQYCFSDPRSRVLAADGRNHLTYMEDTYDLIISEPSNPWLTGVSSLFTRQFFKTAHSRLKPGGIICQWTNLYNLNVEHVFNIMKTVELYFPHIVTFFIPESSDMLLIASDQPLTFNSLGLESFPEQARQQLASLRITSSEQIYQRLMWSSKGLRDREATLPPNSDTYPWLELLAPRDRFFSDVRENVLAMLRFNPVSTFEIRSDSSSFDRLLGKSGSVEQQHAVSMTLYPSGNESSFMRFTGYHFVLPEGELYIAYEHRNVILSELKRYARHFVDDPLAREYQRDDDNKLEYHLFSEDSRKLATVSHCLTGKRTYIFVRSVMDEWKETEIDNTPLPFQCTEGVSP